MICRCAASTSPSIPAHGLETTYQTPAASASPSTSGAGASLPTTSITCSSASCRSYLSRAPALPPLDATTNISMHGAMARIFRSRRRHADRITRSRPATTARRAASAGSLRGRRPSARPAGLRRGRQPGVARDPARTGRWSDRARPQERDASSSPVATRVPAHRRRDGTRRRALPDRHATRHHRAPRLHSGSRRRRADLRAGADRGQPPHRAAPRSAATAAAARGAHTRSVGRRARRPLSLAPSHGAAIAQRARGASGADALRAMALDAARDPVARLHALWTLEDSAQSTRA